MIAQSLGVSCAVRGIEYSNATTNWMSVCIAFLIVGCLWFLAG